MALSEELTQQAQNLIDTVEQIQENLLDTGVHKISLGFPGLLFTVEPGNRTERRWYDDAVQSIAEKMLQKAQALLAAATVEKAKEDAATVDGEGNLNLPPETNE